MKDASDLKMKAKNRRRERRNYDKGKKETSKSKGFKQLYDRAAFKANKDNVDG